MLDAAQKRLHDKCDKKSMSSTDARNVALQLKDMMGVMVIGSFLASLGVIVSVVDALILRIARPELHRTVAEEDKEDQILKQEQRLAEKEDEILKQEQEILKELRMSVREKGETSFK